jgi:hypothetical protein
MKPVEVRVFREDHDPGDEDASVRPVLTWCFETEWHPAIHFQPTAYVDGPIRITSEGRLA